MLKYLLDTNIVIYTMKNRPATVREVFNANEGQLAVSSVTLMELFYGAEKSSNPAKNTRTIETFAARLEILDYDSAAAQHTGQIRAELAKAGRPIGPYDQMIAGHARSLGLIVVSNNVGEFERVPGLRLENWVK
ncbi:type II toxin-antitoxin system tRNA(fMet)-specific endonuclease VapC [Candidatus Vondammii sp. HM_W22]|uniref:type II toxin-antitoxin system tRNA(fMet)-specific endonuclease VapC n=1 Tax=Candidatus Vondammii sp. HM_W22 TaxID=2687299 RepID=UPI001F1389D2|nr:tRNA(fMet)-specific endonuclease VapC [Candidatus Vondammii sp. HM_W22]